MKENTILFDYQIFEMQKYGGISRYFYEIISRQDKGSYELALLFSSNQYIKKKNLCSRFSFIPYSVFKLFKGLFHFFNERYALKRIASSSSIIHPTYYNTYYLSILGNRSLILTVHDMIHEKFPQYFAEKDQTAHNKALLITKASRIIAISNQTKNDLIELLKVDPDKIDVIYHGIDPIKSSYNGLSLPRFYVLYVGERRRYKNYYRLLNVFARLQSEMQDLRLICTGKPFKQKEIETLKELGLSECVSFVNANDDELGQLYRDAQLFVYPSLYEGFGIPILEAYANECPVVLSRASCFPEVAGDAGEYFDPESESEMEQALRRVLTNEERRNELIRLGKERVKLFTWDETARQTQETYRKVQGLM